MQKIQLITRGDDLGAFQAGNRAIVAAFEHGILRNTSLMMPAANVLHAAHLVKNVPGLCLGLHITLTSEWNTPRWGPVSAPETVPSLVDQDGLFFSTGMDLFEHGVRPEEALREVRAQLTLARSLGLDIRYIDEHMGIGWIFHPTDPQRKRLSQAFRRLAYEERLIWHEDIMDMRRVEGNPQELPHSLNELQAGSYLLVTHPAYADPETEAVIGPSHPRPGKLAQERMRDYELLCEPHIMQIVREREIQLARYDEVPLQPPALSDDAFSEQAERG